MTQPKENEKFYSAKNVSGVLGFKEEGETACREMFALLTAENSPLTNADIWGAIIHEPENDNNYWHIHFYAEFQTAMGKQKYLDMFEVGLQVNRERIQIRSVRDSRLTMRYLLHKGYPSKKQYTLDDLVTNAREDFERALQDVVKKARDYTLDDIIACRTLKEVAELVGLQDYGKARQFWLDMQKEGEVENLAVAYAGLVSYTKRLEDTTRSLVETSMLYMGETETRALSAGSAYGGENFARYHNEYLRLISKLENILKEG